MNNKRRVEQAVQRGRDAFRSGDKENPYIYPGAGFVSETLAPWFEKGYNEEQAKAGGEN